MKKLLFALAILIVTPSIAQSSFNTFYKDNNQYSDLSIGLNNSLISGFLSDDDEVKELVKKSEHTKIMIFSDERERTNSNFNKFIKRSKFDELIKIKDEEANINLFILEEEDLIKEIVVQIATGDELVLLGLKTNLTHAELAKIFSDNDITFN